MAFSEDHALETYKSLIAISVEGIKALQLLNGGAIVALLAYLGQVTARADLAVRVRLPLSLFVLGLTLGTLAFATSYLTQLALFNESVQGAAYRGWRHTRWLWWTFGIAVCSLAAFGVGSFTGVSALSTA